MDLGHKFFEIFLHFALQLCPKIAAILVLEPRKLLSIHLHVLILKQLEMPFEDHLANFDLLFFHIDFNQSLDLTRKT